MDDLEENNVVTICVSDYENGVVYLYEKRKDTLEAALARAWSDYSLRQKQEMILRATRENSFHATLKDSNW